MSDDIWNPFPAIRPEETLFSWIVAYSRVAAIAEPREISRRLVGHPTAILRHDFPCRLDELCIRLENHIGTPDDLIRHHTLLPYFSPFLSNSVTLAALEAMHTGNPLPLRTLMGLSTSRLAVGAPLKACPVCIQQDLREAHRALWHRNHQWPTTLVCTEHHAILQVATAEFHGTRQLPLVTPNELPAEAWTLLIAPDNPALLEKLHRLAAWTERFAAQQQSRFSSASLREAYAIGAKEHGYLALDGSVRLGLLRDAFAKYHEELAQLPSLAFLAATRGVNGGFLGQLFRQYDHLHHPAKHIVLAAFLFETWGDFEAAHRLATDQIVQGLPARESVRRAPLNQALDRIRTGASVNSVAHSIGAPPTQLVRHAKREGVDYEQRPRIVRTDKEVQLVALLKAGRSRSSIARRLNIRPAFIKDYLAPRGELKTEWEDRHHDRVRLAHRLRFARTLERNPGVPIKKIRRIPGNGFQWLYNNDREWLIEFLPSIWRR